MILEFEIQGLPKIFSNGSHGHWRGRYAEAKKWKANVANAVAFEQKRAARQFKTLTQARLCLTRFSSVEPDFDGLVISFKNVVDGLVEAGVISGDKVSIIGQPTYLWAKCAPRQGKISVKVEAA